MTDETQGHSPSSEPSTEHAHADQIHVTHGGIQRAEARSIDVTQGGIAIAIGESMTVQQGGVALAFADTVHVEEGSIAFANARVISGDATILFDVRAALLFGTMVGAVLGLLYWLRGRASN